MTAQPPSSTAPAGNKRELSLKAVATLGRLALVFSERRKQLAEGVGLTDQQWQALEEVQTEHFMPSLFAHKRETSAAAVSKILRQLADKGFITAHVSEIDGRHRSYNVTPRGQEILSTLRAERERAIGEIWMTHSESDLAHFAGFGNVVAEQLESLAERSRKTS